ncbi:M50 family metallopeptidase [Catelliglobosispora koreensis]|uniref:M50 family metallopeptidase n=1 Tax=Catelliglobosispora koreensis TaxID=129052 RepID=UPI00037EDCC5|nr:site-2 protease family protein [Catelliglobosispora koreensis]
MLGLLGIVFVAVGILISVSLHEAGHMGTAKGFGMRVTRYFVGFGPTIFSRRKGDTEYGVKALPLGGFVKIVGMTPQDEDADDKRAMWRFPVWKRTIVMAAGSIVHFILAFLIFWGVAATAAMPNPQNLGIHAEDPLTQPAYIYVADCLEPDKEGNCAVADGPAKTAGLATGDKITQLGTVPINNYGDLVKGIRSLKSAQPVDVTVMRNGATQTITVTPKEAERAPIGDPKGAKEKVAVMGIGLDFDPALPTRVEYNAIESFPVGASLMGDTFMRVIEAIKKFPEKIPGLWTAITGGERDPESPVSVVGAARIGGDLAKLHQWPAIFAMIASLNLFIGLFNLLPLLPLDGGHIAIAWFERVRSWLYSKMKKPDPGRVDYYKLMPLTYTVILIFGAFTVLTITADIVNPISLFK